MLKILHVIIGLEVGGAEVMLRRLIEHNITSKKNMAVVSLSEFGVIGNALRKQGIQVHALGMKSALEAPVILWRLIKIMHEYRPNIVQTWMYHADLLGGIAARVAGSCAIVWGVRSTDIPQGFFSITYWVVRLCAIFSYVLPSKIICCAKLAMATHKKLGYSGEKLVVIPNGYDFSKFQRNSKTALQSRNELGYKFDDIVIGTVGRFDTQKDYKNFVTAVSRLAMENDNVKVLMIGRNIDKDNKVLCSWIRDGKAEHIFQMLGERMDVPYCLSAMDIFCLSSVSEAFPNVVVEAMSMSLPCVVTDVGDAADIVGENTYVVPAGDSMALYAALLKMCHLNAMERKIIGEAGARKVRNDYEIKNISCEYDRIYSEVACK